MARPSVPLCGLVKDRGLGDSDVTGGELEHLTIDP